MENKELRLNAQQLVEKFGTDKQKASFSKSGKIRTNIKQAILKIAESQFESVETIKEGRSNVYVLSGERSEALEVEDGRINNGAYSVAYTGDLELIVLSLLLDKSVETDYDQTMRKWLLDFGLISPKLFDLLGSKYNKHKQLELINKLLEANALSGAEESRIVEDYINYSKELQGQLESALKRLAKANIINFYPVYKAKLFGIDEPVQISAKCHAVINDKKRHLMEKLGLSNFDILHLSNKAEVIHFNKLWTEYLKSGVKDDGKEISIDFYFKSHAIHLKATNTRIKKYVDKKEKGLAEKLVDEKVKFLAEKKEKYRDDRLERVIQLAEKHNEYVTEKKLGLGNADIAGLADVCSADEFLKMISIDSNEEYYKSFLEGIYIGKIKALENYHGLALVGN